MRTVLINLVALVLGLVSHTVASASIVIIPPPPAPISSIGVTGKIMMENLGFGGDETAQESGAPSINRGNVANPTYYIFRYSAARTPQNLRNIISRTPVEAGQADLAQALAAQPTIMDDIAAGVRTYGFDPHNVADAYAVWWINVWGASEKRNVEPDPATVAAVKQQVYAAFAATPDFAATSDADRQEFAEALLLQAAMLGSAFEQNKNNPEMLDRLADAARKGAKASYGIDLQTMTLTSNGFVPRKGADASGAVAGEEDTIRNARTDAPAAEGESSGLGLALAAGAGLGVTLLGGLALMRRG